ncbi:MAG: hypothetical protein AAFP19_26295 [Bacteroidota bacterium]
MAKPILQFADDPPIIINCGQSKTVQLAVTPQAIGDCTVSLNLALKSCHFEDGSNEMSQAQSATAADEKMSFTFNIEINCETPDTYFTLLYAVAQNAAGEKSYRKSIELDINC